MKTRFKKSKLYGIFQRNEKGLLGYVERSFDMTWETDKVRVWRDLAAAKHNVDVIRRTGYSTGEVFIVRFNSNDCPVVLKDWHPHKAAKFNWRNAKFEEKVLTPSGNFTD